MKVAIVGVGNCSCSLVQAIYAAKEGSLIPTGVSHPDFGGYSPSDLEIVAAFDIDERKIGKDLSEAIFSAPNCTTKYFDIPRLAVTVSSGILADGVAPHMEGMFKIEDKCREITVEDVASVLISQKAQIVVIYLPVGSQKAAELYAEACLKAGCALVNCTPATLANSEKFSTLFEDHKLPLLGDDIKSQVGSTAIHRALIDILQKKGVVIDRTYQLNIGGNTDFMNMRNPERSISKKQTKENSLNHLFVNSPELGVGPSDYVPQLKDHKVGYINIEGTGILGMPFSIELKLKVEDSPNSAGVVLNAIRAAKLALDNKLYGVIDQVCPWFFKNPPVQLDEDTVYSSLENFISENSRKG